MVKESTQVSRTEDPLRNLKRYIGLYFSLLFSSLPSFFPTIPSFISLPKIIQSLKKRLTTMQPAPLYHVCSRCWNLWTRGANSCTSGPIVNVTIRVPNPIGPLNKKAATSAESSPIVLATPILTPSRS